MKKNNLYSRKKVVISLIIFGLLIILGVSYAFFSYIYNGNSQNIVQTGEIKFLASDETINLTNVFPTTYKKATDVATVSIYGYTTYENGIDFTIKAIDVKTKNDNIVPRIVVERENVPGVSYTDGKEIQTIYTKDNRITSDTTLCEGNIAPNTAIGTKDEYVKILNIKVYYDKADYHISDNTKELLIEEGRLTPNYEGQIIDTNTWNNLEENGNAYSFKIQVNATEAGPQKYLKNKVLETLPLTEEDALGTKYVYGSSVDNNYVWYSGKLWRITAINDDGTIKLATNNTVTILSWETTCSSNDYSNSLVRDWLNTYFSETLNNKDLLVNSEWDYTPSSNTDIVIPNKTNIVTDKVGLLNLYEYSMAGSNSYLNIKYVWWTLTPMIENSNNLWQIGGEGDSFTNVSCDARGIRPSIVFADNVLYSSGDGTLANPYRIENDISEAKANDNLNTRISGEYVKFNNTLYRIVDKETVNGNLLTKVTMTDYNINRNSISQNQVYATDNDDKVFNMSNGIGKMLNDWYLNNINSTYRDMIATSEDGIKWYSGPLTGVYRDYTIVKTGTEISATIGLPYYGEVFSSQMGVGYHESFSFWTMTRYNDSVIWVLSDWNTGSGYELSSEAAVRPSFYLKSDVKIVSGTGLPNDPYEITMN